MPKQGEYDNTYPDKLKNIGITLLEPFKGSKKHHLMQCDFCSFEWTATPKSKIQNYKIHNMKGCPECTKKQRYSSSRESNLKRLKDRGIEILTEGYDGRRSVGDGDTTYKKITVKNLKCGHVFQCSPQNLLGAETECGVCGPSKRAVPLTAYTKENSKKWQQTASEWQKYRQKAHALTRITYSEHNQRINPHKYIRGKAGIKGAYQLDHIVSIRFCFDNDIPLEVCAHHTNLQMLKWEDNIGSKHTIKGTLPYIFLQYIDSGKRLILFANDINDKVFHSGAELFKNIDGVVLTIYDATTNVGILLIPYDKSYANMKIAHHGRKLMIAKGIRPFIIFEDELNNNIIINKIRHYIGISTADIPRIHARKCSIRQISKEAKALFLNEHHIQGSIGATYSYGAFYGDKLMAVMTFGKPRVLLGYNTKKSNTEFIIWELSRFATNTKYRIPGIASKLLEYFKKHNEWNRIISYADKRWSTGNLYNVLGFTMEKSNKPDYFYVIDGKRKHRWNYRKDILKRTLPNYDPMLTEYQNMTNAGHWRIWDCGTYRFILDNI